MAYAGWVTNRLERIVALCRQRVPGLRLVDKQQVWWMRWVGTALRPIVPEFADRYTTVIGDTVFLPRPPEALPQDQLASTLAHELVHQLDQKEYRAWFYISYALGMPAGRTMRAYWERRAYAVDLMLAMERGGPNEVRRVANHLVEIFRGPAYFWMWAGRMSASEYLRPVVEDVLDGSIHRREPYRSILAAWRGVDPETL